MRAFNRCETELGFRREKGTDLDARLVEVANVGCALSRLLAEDDGVLRDQSCRHVQKAHSRERRMIARKASMTTLPLTDWIGSTTTATALWVSRSNDCQWTVSTNLVRQTSERADLLRVDVDVREPATEARVRVVPSDDHLRSVLRRPGVSAPKKAST